MTSELDPGGRGSFSHPKQEQIPSWPRWIKEIFPGKPKPLEPPHDRTKRLSEKLKPIWETCRKAGDIMMAFEQEEHPEWPTNPSIAENADVFVSPIKKPKKISLSYQNRLQQFKEKAKQKILRWADVADVGLFLSLLKHQIIPNIVPEYPEGFDKEFIEIAKNPNVVFFLLPTHQSLADVIPVAKVSKKITELIRKARHNKDFPGFVLTMAKSLEANGKGQGEFIEEAVRQLQPWLKSNYLTLDGYVREKDQEKYGLSPLVNMGHNKRLVYNIRDGAGRGIFPEATVESGRFIKRRNQAKGVESSRNTKFDNLLEFIRMVGEEEARNRINGMQYFDKTISIVNILEIAKKYNMEIAFIQIGSNGSFRIIDHNGEKPIPTWEAWGANFDPRNTPELRRTIKTLLKVPILKDATEAFLEIMGNLEIDKSLMDVKVGMPLKASKMRQEIMENKKDLPLDQQEPTNDEYCRYLGKGIAALLPEDARGVYA